MVSQMNRVLASSKSAWATIPNHASGSISKNFVCYASAYQQVNNFVAELLLYIYFFPTITYLSKQELPKKKKKPPFLDHFLQIALSCSLYVKY